MDKGTLVEFRQGGTRILAVVERPEGKKHWVVLDARGHSHTLHPREITYTIAGASYTAEQLVKFAAQVEPLLDASVLEVAWELLVEDGEAIAPKALAQLLFSDPSPVYEYASHCLLSEDKLYFKQRKELYEPRSATLVAELKYQIQVAQQRQQQWAELVTRVQGAIAGEGVEWQASDRSIFEGLERLVLEPEAAKTRSSALELLQSLGRAEAPDAALQLLIDLQLWSPHENLYLRRTQTPTTFSAKVIDVALSRLANPPTDPDLDHRLDLTHLKVYTIDDESTQEIDDGLSVEILPTGERLWVHIADPTRWLSPGDDLDLEARRRGTTVYLPEQVIPMFPMELATGPMSLVQGKVCCALSFGVELDGTGQVVEYQLHSSLIKPTYRLTYRDVDEILELGVEQEPELQTLYGAAQLRQRWRQSQGSITIRMPESSIKVADDEINIEVLEESASRQLVAEMMILAGEIAGRYGQAHNLAIPFRNQPQPELPSDDDLLALPPGPVRECAIRRCMPRSEVSLTPVGHASLGLAVYTQVTSPIRRYSDLLAHFQLKAHLRGESLPFGTDQVQELILTLGSVTYEATQLERQTKHYWALEYLRRQGDRPWSALMLRWLREYENLALVMLEDLGLELAVRLERHTSVGEPLLLRVKHVDPRREVIQFHQVVETAA